MTKKRLAKFLARAGVASRRVCEELIFSGRVKVNRSVTYLPQTMVDASDVITVDDQRIKNEETRVYFLLNKPLGYFCSPVKHQRRKLVTDLFKNIEQRLFTVGRLDKDTTGLLIVTNDGDFAQQIIHPSSNLQKEYVAKTGHEITDEHLKTISGGIKIDGVFVKPIRVKKVRKGTVKVTVSEGKKREVRLLIQAAGLEVRELKRTRIGGLLLGDLSEGAWRPMSEKEKSLIFS